MHADVIIAKYIHYMFTYAHVRTHARTHVRDVPALAHRYTRWNDENAAETCDRVFFSMSGINSYFAMRTLGSDAIFAAGSFVFVGIFVSFHTRSAVLGILGILQVRTTINHTQVPLRRGRCGC